MESVLSFFKIVFSNSWVIGIGGGTISGILTNLILKKIENSKYIEKIDNANSEIILTLSSYIYNEGDIEDNIINSIISSVSRKYKINVKELYTINIIYEELIFEIIRNIYVSSENKKNYCSLLLSKLDNFYENNKNKEIKMGKNINENISYKNEIVTFTSFYVAFISGISLFITNYENNKINSPIIIIVIIIVLIIGGILLSLLNILESKLIKHIKKFKEIKEKNLKK